MADRVSVEDLKQAAKDARESGDEGLAAYYERVAASRKVPRADVESHEVVLNNEDSYPDEVVEAQKQFEDERGNVPVSDPGGPQTPGNKRAAKK
jgi:propanediol dehydratase small subunit